MTATQTWGASCLLISTAVFNSSPVQPQTRASSSTGSDAVMSHTVSSHSTSRCGQLHWWARLPAQKQTVDFLLYSFICLPHRLPALCQWQCKRDLFSAQDLNHRGIFPPAFQKWMEFSCSILSLQLLQGMGMIHEKILHYLLLSSTININTTFFSKKLDSSLFYLCFWEGQCSLMNICMRCK